MRTQATQTEVKKSCQGQQTPASVAPTVHQKHAASPRVQQKAWMVSESVQTNGVISPSSNYQSLGRAGYQVKVYDLDAPAENSSKFSPPRSWAEQNGRNCQSVDQQVNYSSNSVKLNYDISQGNQPKFR